MSALQLAKAQEGHFLLPGLLAVAMARAIQEDVSESFFSYLTHGETTAMSMHECLYKLPVKLYGWALNTARSKCYKQDARRTTYAGLTYMPNAGTSSRGLKADISKKDSRAPPVDPHLVARARKAVRFMSLATSTLPTRASLNVKAKIGQTIPNKHLRIRTVEAASAQPRSTATSSVAWKQDQPISDEDEDEDEEPAVRPFDTEFIPIGAYVATRPTSSDAPFWIGRVDACGPMFVSVTWFESISDDLYVIEEEFEGHLERVDASAIIADVSDLVTKIDMRSLQLDVDSVLSLVD